MDFVLLSALQNQFQGGPFGDHKIKMQAEQNGEREEGDQGQGHDCHTEPQQGWQDIVFVDDSVDEEAVDDEKEDQEEFAPDDQLEELDVVLGADAVVEPFAVVVEVLHTSVATIAVKGPVADAGFAQVTKIFLLLRVEL